MDHLHVFGFAVVFAITPILRKALLLLRPLPAGDCNAWHCRQARVEYLQWLSQHEWGSCRQSATSVASSPYCRPQQKPQLALFLHTLRKGRVSEPVRKQKEGREKVERAEKEGRESRQRRWSCGRWHWKLECYKLNAADISLRASDCSHRVLHNLWRPTRCPWPSPTLSPFPFAMLYIDFLVFRFEFVFRLWHWPTGSEFSL